MRIANGTATLLGLLGALVVALSMSCSTSSSEPSGSGGDRDKDASSASGDDDDDVPITGTSANGALRIASVDIVGDHVTDPYTGKTVRVVALVTDKKGSDHIAGGDLRGSTGKLAVPFDAKGNGRYEAEVGWDDVARVQAISFVGPGGVAKLVAKFVDGDNNEATAEVPIPLQCTEPSYAACAGACTAPVDSDWSNCGQCGKQCKVERCTHGECIGFVQSYSNAPESCKELCALHNSVCANTCDYPGKGKILGQVSFSGEPQRILTDCDTVPAPAGSGTFATQDCCCKDP